MSIRIPFYVTERGLLLHIKANYPEQIRVNLKPLTKTFHPEWWITEDESELATYSTWAGRQAVNERYVLENEAVEGIAPVLKKEQVVRDEEGRWDGPHKGLDSLYRSENDWLDLGFKLQEFEPEHLGKLTFSKLGDRPGSDPPEDERGSDRGGRGHLGSAGGDRVVLRVSLKETFDKRTQTR